MSKTPRIYKVRTDWINDTNLCRRQSIDETIERTIRTGSARHGHQNIMSATKVVAVSRPWNEDREELDLLSSDYRGKLLGNSFARLLKSDWRKPEKKTYDAIEFHFEIPESASKFGRTEFVITLTEAYIA